MGLDDEIEEVRGPGLDTRIGRFAEDALLQIAQNGRQSISPLLPDLSLLSVHEP